MPTEVPGSSIGVGVQFAPGAFNTVYILETDFIISQDDIAIEAFADNNFVVNGEVHGDIHGIRLGVEVSGGEVYVGDTGNVSASRGSAIRGVQDGQGSQGSYSVTNDGDISSFGNEATIHFEGNPFNPDFDFFGHDYAIVNNGIISNVHDGEATAAIRFVNVGLKGQIYNAEDGVISAIGEKSAAIEVTGQIFQTPDGTVQSSELIFDNAGEVYGDWWSYRSLRNGNDHVTNTGILSGDVELGVDDDIYDGQGGEIIGTVFGDFGQDVLIGGALSDSLSGGSDADRLIGNGGADVLDGGDGADVMRGGEGADQMDGGSGADVMTGGLGRDVIFGAGGGDQIGGGDGADEIDGGNGADTLSGGGGDDTVIGGGSADVLRGGAGDDTLSGDAGSDTLRGGEGNDSLSGGASNDTLNGGWGNDSLTGGNGVDTFVFGVGSEHDVITDYQDGTDLLDVSALAFTAFAADIAPFLVQSGVDVVVDLSFGALSRTVTIENEIIANIDATDFVF